MPDGRSSTETPERRGAAHHIFVEREDAELRLILSRQNVHDSKLGRVDGGDITDRARSPGIRRRAVAQLEKHLRLGWVRTVRNLEHRLRA